MRRCEASPQVERDPRRSVLINLPGKRANDMTRRSLYFTPARLLPAFRRNVIEKAQRIFTVR